MKVTCPQCDRAVAYRELDTHTVLRDGEFTTTYRCPHCDAELDGIEVT